MRLGTETPQDIVALAGVVDGFVTFGAMTAAAPTHGLATAVVIRDQIVFPVDRVLTGADPGHRAEFGARRTTGHTIVHR